MEQMNLAETSRHFSRYVAAGGGSRYAAAVAALVAEGVAAGHVCLALDAIAGATIAMDGGEFSFPPAADLAADLLLSPLVGRPGERKPLILDGECRLYLYRYREYEREVAAFIVNRAVLPPPVVDEAGLRDGLSRLFAPSSGETDWQKIAAVAAIRKRFAVISGGPGTGKTSTVVRILALLLEQAPGLRIALAAPTGKAAARLRESIRSTRDTLSCVDEVRGRIPHEVSTIHRLLGYVEGSVRFRHGAANPLPHDVVVVDEASMVSLPLMAKLMGAIRPEGRLILLGDRDQLASVEAGAVLGDICGEAEMPPYSASFASFAASVAGESVPAMTAGTPGGMIDSLVVLRKTYRFGADSGIRSAAELVNSGDGETLLRLAAEGLWNDLALTPLPGVERLKETLRPRVLGGYRRYLAAVTPEEALSRFDEFRILCALRTGAFGVGAMNAIVAAVLAEDDLINPADRWYHGRPVLVTANDYGLRLFNGDVGIILRDPADGALRACFPAPDGTVRKIAPIRLPSHETAYAMTVHKSQGSEFERVLLVLPERDVPVMTRELVYTGITRARSAVEVVADRDAFVAAASRRVCRASGLAASLWRQGQEM